MTLVLADERGYFSSTAQICVYLRYQRSIVSV